MKSAIAIAFVIAGCGALAPKPTETLGETIQSYNEAILWGRYGEAAIHLPAKQRSLRINEWDEREHDLKITQYDVVDVVQKGPREARVQIKMSWYKESEGTVHETSALQTWERHDKLWLMVDEARLRGTEMPGLPEALMKEDGKKADKADGKPADKTDGKLDPAPSGDGTPAQSAELSRRGN